MKVLLITSRSWAGYNISPPIGLYHLKTALARRDIDSEILDFDLMSGEEQLERARNGHYSVIGMSVTHINMADDLDSLMQFREAAFAGPNRCEIVAGGQEATLNARQWLETGVVDVCFFGFCNKIFAEYCEQLRAGGFASCTSKEILGDLSGVAYLGTDGRYISRPSPVLTQQEFDEIFYEDLLKLEVPYEIYWAKARKMRVDAFNSADFIVETVRLYTSSHCPRKCGFCSSQNFLPLSQGGNSKIIALSARKLCEIVLHHSRKYGARAFMFSDDDFPIGGNAGLARFDDFCRLMIDAKRTGLLPEEVQFFCQSRVLNLMERQRDRSKTVNRERIRLMKDAGFCSIGMGVETFSERLLRSPSINKVGTSADDIHAVIDGLLEIGITPMTFLILGIPESSVDDLIDTIRDAANYLLKGADIGISTTLKVHPGSPVALYHLKEYSVTEREWCNPRTGARVKILDNVLPRDPRMAWMVKELEPQREGVISKFKSRYGWSVNAILPKSLIAILSFRTAADLVGNPELARELDDMAVRRMEISHGSQRPEAAASE